MKNVIGFFLLFCMAPAKSCTNYDPLTFIYNGKPAPIFQLQDQNGKLFQSNSLQGKWHILFFPPKSTNYFDNVQLLRNFYPWIVQQNVEVICVFNDNLAGVQENYKRLELPFIMLSDEDKTILHRVIDHNDHPLTLIIDENGIIKKAIVKPDPEHHVLEMALFLIKNNLKKKEQFRKEYQYASLLSEVPDFVLYDELGSKRSINEFRGKQCLLLFLPIENDRIEAKHLSYLVEIYDWLKELNTEVIWLSAHKYSSLAAIKEKLKIPFITLDDSERRVSSRYDVSSWIHESYTSFIIDEKGIVRRIIDRPDTEKQIAQTLLYFMKKDLENANLSNATIDIAKS